MRKNTRRIKLKRNGRDEEINVMSAMTVDGGALSIIYEDEHGTKRERIIAPGKWEEVEITL